MGVDGSRKHVKTASATKVAAGAALGNVRFLCLGCRSFGKCQLTSEAPVSAHQ